MSVSLVMRDDQAHAFTSKLARGTTEKLLVPVPQKGLVIGSPGSPTMQSGTVGTTIVATGFSAGYAIREGQFFSHVAGGVRYLYRVTADATANGSGAATFSINTMLRVPPSTGDALEFATPKIEGFTAQQSQGWTLGQGRAVAIDFTVVEAQ